MDSTPDQQTGEDTSAGEQTVYDRHISLRLAVGLLITTLAWLAVVALISQKHPFTVGEWMASVGIFGCCYLAGAIFSVTMHRPHRYE